MMKFKPEYFTAAAFIFVIGALMLSAVYNFASRKIKYVMDDTRQEAKIEWEKIYPFDDGRKETAKEKQSFYKYIKSRLEEYTSERLPGYHRLVESAKRYENALGWNMVSVFDYNAVVRLKDGYLTTYTMSLDVTHDAESVKEFADFCAGRGIDFAYINFPKKICVSEDKEISGVLDFANQNADKFLAMLTESGVRNYDFRKNLHEAGMNHHEAFFVTDHHWKPETGLWAAGEVLKILRDDFGWNVDPDILRPENFRYEIYPEWFLGSQGKKVTLARTKPDNFTMIYPKFATVLKFEVPTHEINTSGDFSITYNMKEVEPINYYGKNPYAAYIYADLPLLRIDNRLINNGKRLLIIHDSMSNCVIPFVALGVQHVDAIDLRHFTGSAGNFVETVKPDAVIVMYLSNFPGRKPSEMQEIKKTYNFM